MNLSDLSNQVLAYIVTYGPAALGLVVFLAALGVPLPSTFFIIAGGAFIQQGVLDLYATTAATLAGAVFGDMLSFGVGLLLRHPIQARFGQAAGWHNAQIYFNRQGGLAIYLTRWLFTPAAVPVNLIAGGSGYSVWNFSRLVALGELTWVLAYGSLGYAFGSQWEYVSDFISNFSGLLVGLAILAIGMFWLLRRPARPA